LSPWSSSSPARRVPARARSRRFCSNGCRSSSSPFLRQREISDRERGKGGSNGLPRRRKVNGREYWFITPEKFERLVEDGEFLEHVDLPWGARSGTLRSEIDRIQAQ